jgi:hypothetical protein
MALKGAINSFVCHNNIGLLLCDLPTFLAGLCFLSLQFKLLPLIECQQGQIRTL